MSRGNIAFELETGKAERPSTTPVALINVDDATYGKVGIFGFCGGAPGTYAQTAGKWAGGAICIDTVGKIAYSNQSAVSATPVWTVLS